MFRTIWPFLFVAQTRIKITKCNNFLLSNPYFMIIPYYKHWKKWNCQKSLVVPFSFPWPLNWRQTNKRLLAHFISFRGYRTDWVSTTVAVEAYGSKATLEENLKSSRCNRKDQNNSAGFTRGTIQFVMWNHGVSAAQWETAPGDCTGFSMWIARS